jgi:acyl-CoA synthetase (AMP-forming)/AMP-acid ligase II
MTKTSVEGIEAEIVARVERAEWEPPAKRSGWILPGKSQAQSVEALMLRSFRYQADAIPAYAAYVRHLDIDPARVKDWREIPPVPASAFKSHDLSAAPADAAVPADADAPAAVTFETSGTSISQPGRVRLSSTKLYETSLLRNYQRHLLPDGAKLRAVVLGPSVAEAPSSSLWFMVDRVVREYAVEALYLVHHGDARWKAADDAFRLAAAADEPLLLLGTSLLFMAYFERLRIMDFSFRLPEGTRVMDTGGAKGQIAEFTRAQVEQGFERRLGIPASHVVNEYGMAEMGSQFYDDGLIAAHERRAPKSGKQIPPWVRTRVLDPETLNELPDGETGILVHYDLANLQIPLAIQTEDVGRREGDRLILEGRLLGAEARGCSLAFEDFLKSAPASAAPASAGSAPA